MNKYLLLLVFIFSVTAGKALGAGGPHDKCQSVLLPKIEKIINHSKAKHAYWSLTVRDTTGTLLQCFHSNKLMQPASNLKLLVSATALKLLGPHYRYQTTLYGRGKLVDSVWVGDIIVRGTGDPSISGFFYNHDKLQVFHEFYRALKSMGIKKIRGNLVGNDSYFDQKPYPEGWDWDDLSYYYAVPISALSFNNNAIDVTIYGYGDVGSQANIEWFPFNTDYVTIINEINITPSNTYFNSNNHRLLGTNTIIMKGSIPKGRVAQHSLSIANPSLYFMTTLKHYLQKGGIEITGSPVVNHQSHNWENVPYEVLAVHVSPPLYKLIRHMNKESVNFYAEMLLKTIAAEYYNTQGSTELGISLEKKFASSIGIDVSKMSLSDGSGLSEYDLITTNALSKILVAMYGNSFFMNSLPVGGIDGTLEYRFNDSPLEGNIFAKTGYISGVRSISGYLKTKSNNTIIFSMITNGYAIPTRYVDSTESDILTVLYNHY